MFGQKQRKWVLLGLLACGGAFWGCGEQKPETAPPPAEGVAAETLLGTWVMYGTRESGLFSAEALGEEMSFLTLNDSTYSLTYSRPGIMSFVESGRVEYDDQMQRVMFTVMSASGVDWSGEEPRKLVDVPDVVPWQRDPGVEYMLEWNVEGIYIALWGEGWEASYFKRMEASGAPTVDLGVGTRRP